MRAGRFIGRTISKKSTHPHLRLAGKPGTVSYSTEWAEIPLIVPALIVPTRTKKIISKIEGNLPPIRLIFSFSFYQRVVEILNLMAILANPSAYRALRGIDYPMVAALRQGGNFHRL